MSLKCIFHPNVYHSFLQMENKLVDASMRDTKKAPYRVLSILYIIFYYFPVNALKNAVRKVESFSVSSNDFL